MAHPHTIISPAEVPMSANARHQFQQYLSRVPAAASSSSSSTSNNPSTDIEVLLRRSANLSTQVDALHSKFSDGPSSANSANDDPQLFWTTLTLLTNLRELSARLQGASSSDRRVNEALTRTQQNVGIVESLLRLSSVTGTETEGREGGDAFTAPVRSAPVQQTKEAGAERGYEYWKQQTLSALDDDDSVEAFSAGSTFEDEGKDDSGNASDADSILTDPEIHLAPTTSSATNKTSNTPLAASNPPKPTPTKTTTSPNTTAPNPPPHPTPFCPFCSTAPTASAASDTILQSDRATHEALSSELLRMASVLKSNSLAFADALERDRLLLEKAGTDLGQNLDLMTRTRGRLGIYSKKARSMGWFTLGAILVVVVSWMMMFVLIRLT